MRLPEHILVRSDARMVQRINEIYHDLESTCYDQRHRSMGALEETFWSNAARKYLVTEAPVVCLDYGTGTGFVPTTVGPYLKEADSLICCDVSANMLGACQRAIEQRSLACRCSFRKIEAGEIPADTHSVDVITVNSVLHHIFDLDIFCLECKRVLKKGGLLLAAHEPNTKQGLPFQGKVMFLLATTMLRPKAFFIRVAERVPILESFLRPVLSAISKGYRSRNEILSHIARQLKQEGFVDFILRGTEIQQIVDFHSQRGFDRQELLAKVFQKFELVEFETYNHLGFFPSNAVARAIEKYLRKKWPDAGKQIRFVLRRL